MINYRCILILKTVFFIQIIFFQNYVSAVNSLTVTLNPWFNSINPNTTISIESIFVTDQVFEPLMRINSDGSISGCLINSWDVSSDAKKFHFKLKKDVHFSDGTLLTTKHIQGMLNEAIQSRMFASLERILGANNYRRKKTKMILGLKIINDQEFEINSVLPFPNLILQLASSNISVFLRQHNSDKLLGTGAYMVSSFDRKNQVINLQKNPYYIRKPFFYDQIIFNHKFSIQTDISEVSPEQDNLTNYNLNEYFISQVYLLGFNANNKKLSNLQTRKYLSCLFPINNLTYEHDSIIPMGIFGYNSSIHFECDDVNHPPKELVNYNLTYYLDSMKDTVINFCEILNKKSIKCNANKVASVEELKNLKKNGTLEIFIARFMATVPLAEDLFSSFYIDHPINIFDNSGTTYFSSNFDNEYDKLYNINPNSKDELMDVYTKLNKLIIQNYIARPISYGTAEKLWVKKGIYIPDIGITGLMGVDLTNVKKE